MIAAPAPCAHRAAMRAPTLGAAAQAAEVRVNTTIPTARALFAPMRSARLPANNNRQANSRV
jgi:hypothetical protein